MRRFRTSLLVYCFQALKGDLELESESVAAACIAQRQEFKFQLPIPKRLLILTFLKNTGTYRTVLYSTPQENLLIEIEFGAWPLIYTKARLYFKYWLFELTPKSSVQYVLYCPLL
jgi:hypothetical protein